jgi:hypothetical protein
VVFARDLTAYYVAGVERYGRFGKLTFKLQFFLFLINGLYYNYYNFLRIKLLLNKYSFYKFLINLLLQSVYNPISSTIFSIMSVNATETCLINVETFGTFLKVVQGLVKAEDS